MSNQTSQTDLEWIRSFLSTAALVSRPVYWFELHVKWTAGGLWVAVLCPSSQYERVSLQCSLAQNLTAHLLLSESDKASSGEGKTLYKRKFSKSLKRQNNLSLEYVGASSLILVSYIHELVH